MSCCGQSRSQAGIVVSGLSPKLQPGTVIFEYVGKTALTAQGRVTGVRYRFESPGAPVLVDSRDRASLDALPMLKQVG